MSLTPNADEASAPGAGSRTPPYVAYRTFLTFLEDLKANGLPPQIDRSVLKRFSGGVGAQLMMALRSLGLVNERNEPTQLLAELVDAQGTSQFAVHMREALRFGYPFLHKLDLMTATPSMFAEAFKVTGVKEDVLKKCRRFFLQAAAENGMTLGPRLANAGGLSRQRSTNGGGAGTFTPRAPRSASSPIRRTPARRKPPEVAPDPVLQSIQQQLVAKFPDFDPAWPDSLKEAWFSGFKHLMASAAESGTNENGDLK